MTTQEKFNLFIATLKERLSAEGESLISVQPNSREGGAFVRITNKGCIDCYLVYHENGGMNFIRVFGG